MVSDGKVIAMNYVLSDDAGKVIDASEDHPLHYLHGHQNIVPGLERELTGMEVGEKKKVQVPPGEGYGEYDKELRFRVPADRFSGAPEKDMIVLMRDGSGHSLVARVDEVDEQAVVLDANHPLAGQSLNFDVEIVSIRDATTEELSHGHVHGPGGHHH